MTLTGYLAAADLEHELRDELTGADVRMSRRPHGRLVLSTDAPFGSAWAANVWHDVEEIRVTSIGHAAKELRDRQRNWAMYAPLHGGRAKLIAEKLPHVSAKPILIGDVVPDAPLGSFTLLEPDLMLAATRCTSPFPNGEARLVEDREGPPSRAYLKLYEAFVRLRRWPTPERDVSRSRCEPGRVDVVAGPDRCVGVGRRQGAVGSVRGEDAERALARGVGVRARASRP